jgi:hypothetical protein
MTYSNLDWEKNREDLDMLWESDWTLKHGHNPNPKAKKLKEEDLSAFSYLNDSDQDQ